MVAVRTSGAFAEASGVPEARSSAQAEASVFDEPGLLARLRAGDDAAFESVMRELGGRLLATARRFLPNEEDARDAVQESFLAAFKNIARFDAKSKFSTWIHRILINACLMKLRSKRRRPEQSLDDALPRFDTSGLREHPALAATENLAERMDDAAMRERMREEIERLPDEYRTVILLRDIEELDTEETSGVLGVSVSAVKTRLHRARQALRERMLPYLAADETGLGGDGASASPSARGGARA